MSMFPTARECDCGSGEIREEVCDARGLFVAYCCDRCKGERLAGFRPEIFSDGDYDCDEPIEPDWEYDTDNDCFGDSDYLD